MTYPAKIFFVTSVSCFLLLAIFAGIFYFRTQQISDKSLEAAVLPTIVDLASERPVRMLFVGDIMLDRGVKKIVDTYGGGDYFFLFKNVRDVISGADIVFGNLEGPIAAGGARSGSIYSFRMNPMTASVLRDVGFTVVSFANNHTGDYGRDAFLETLQNLASAHIEYVGAGETNKEATTPKIIIAGNMRIGFVGFSDVGPRWLEVGTSTAGIAIARDREFVTEVVRQARDKVDILITSFHFGDEYKTRSNSRQQALARAAVDAGAALVVGHHPHVAEELEKYHGGVIAYSLGNFIFDQAFSEDTKKAFMLEVTARNGAIENIRQIPIIFNKYFQPMIAQVNNP